MMPRFAQFCRLHLRGARVGREYWEIYGDAICAWARGGRKTRRIRKIGIRAEQFIDALDSMVYTYDIADVLLEWRKRAKFSIIENGEKMPVEIDVTDAPELVGLIYEICVYMFGDYEDTPRTGWIEDVDEFCEFIDKITCTALEMTATANYDVEDDIDE